MDAFADPSTALSWPHYLPLLASAVQSQKRSAQAIDIDAAPPTAMQCVLKAGDLLFVPAGTPHQVANTKVFHGKFKHADCVFSCRRNRL